MSSEEKTVDGLLVAERDLQGLRKLRQAGLLLSSRGSDDETRAAWTPPHQDEDARVVQFNEHGRVTLLNLGGKRLHRHGLLDPDSIAHFTALQTLNLGGTDLPGHDTVQVLAAVASTTLTTVYLGGNGLGNAGAALLASWMMAASTMSKLALVKLDLRYNDITGQGMTALCQTGFPHCPNLTILHLEGNRIGDDGCAALADCMRQPNNNGDSTTQPTTPCRLEQLFLGANRIGPVGAAHLATVLNSSSVGLTKLYLEGNHIGADGAAAVRRALEDTHHKSTLRNLYVDNNDIGKEESQRLAKALNNATVISIGLED
jgi:Leucine-rich repeat (LRR) protein